jgi:hypothetical protein
VVVVVVEVVVVPVVAVEVVGVSVVVVVDDRESSELPSSDLLASSAELDAWFDDAALSPPSSWWAPVEVEPSLSDPAAERAASEIFAGSETPMVGAPPAGRRTRDAGRRNRTGASSRAAWTMWCAAGREASLVELGA